MIVKSWEISINSKKKSKFRLVVPGRRRGVSFYSL